MTDAEYRTVTLTDGSTVRVPPNYANAHRTATTAAATGATRALIHDINSMVTRIGAPAPFPASIVSAIGWREARLSATAVSSAGARGPFQLMPSVYGRNGIDPANWRACVPVVVRMLRNYVRHANNTGTDDETKMLWALEAYARGVGSVTSRGIRPSGPDRARVTHDIARIFAGY